MDAEVYVACMCCIFSIIAGIAGGVSLAEQVRPIRSDFLSFVHSSIRASMFVRVCVCRCIHACVRACLHASMPVCMDAGRHACVSLAKTRVWLADPDYASTGSAGSGGFWGGVADVGHVAH